MAGIEWALLDVGDNFAMRHGLPPRIPVPKDEVEGMADKGLPVHKVREWVGAYMQSAPSSWRQQNNELASRFDAFVAKQPHLEKAQKAFGSQNFAGAVKALELVIRVDKNDHHSRLNLGMALAASGQNDKALEHFTSVGDTFKGDAEYHVGLANVLLAKGERDPAIEELINALEAQPDHRPAMDALAQLGILVAIYENPRDAASLTYVRSDLLQQYLEGLWDETPHDAQFFVDQLVYHESERRAHIALAAAERAAKAEGHEAHRERIELGRIAALHGLGRSDEAEKAALALCESLPDSPAGWVELGRFAQLRGEADKAREHFEEALKRDPGDQLALSARFWPENSDDVAAMGEALPALAEYAKSHAECAGAQRSLARAKLAINAVDEALELFGKAVSLDPDNEDQRAEYWSELGKAERFAEVISDAEKLGNMQNRSWQLRWSEAEAYRLAGRMQEARAAFIAINADDKLHVDVRKRAKRAAQSITG